MQKFIQLSSRNANGFLKIALNCQSGAATSRRPINSTTISTSLPFRAFSQSPIIHFADSSASKSGGGRKRGLWSTLTGSNSEPTKSEPASEGRTSSRQQKSGGDKQNREQSRRVRLDSFDSQQQQPKQHTHSVDQQQDILSTSSRGRNQSGTMKSGGVGQNKSPINVRQDDGDAGSGGSSRAKSSTRKGSLSGKYDPERVKHNKIKHRFDLDLGQGQRAFIEYRLLETKDGNVIEMFHTEVPQDMRGRGIGKVLARGALMSTQQVNLKCILTCSYLIDYMKRFASESDKKSVIDL